MLEHSIRHCWLHIKTLLPTLMMITSLVWSMGRLCSQLLNIHIFAFIWVIEFVVSCYSVSDNKSLHVSLLSVVYNIPPVHFFISEIINLILLRQNKCAKQLKWHVTNGESVTTMNTLANQSLSKFLHNALQSIILN